MYYYQEQRWVYLLQWRVKTHNTLGEGKKASPEGEKKSSQQEKEEEGWAEHRLKEMLETHDSQKGG
jgi:hypothetical protein